MIFVLCLNFGLNVRFSYYDLLNLYFHMIQKLCKGDFNFDLVRFSKCFLKKDLTIILSGIQNERSITNNIETRQHSDARFLRLGIAKEFSLFPKTHWIRLDERNRLVGVAWRKDG